MSKCIWCLQEEAVENQFICKACHWQVIVYKRGQYIKEYNLVSTIHLCVGIILYQLLPATWGLYKSVFLISQSMVVIGRSVTIIWVHGVMTKKIKKEW